MNKSRKTVKAEYCGYVDLGAACFSVHLSELLPKSQVKNRVLFRSRVGDEFIHGHTYTVTVESCSDYNEVISVSA